MRNFRKWRTDKAKRSERARKAAAARWDAERRARAEEPVREDLPLVPLRLTIEQHGQPRRVLELRRKSGTSMRTWMFENGQNCGAGGKCLLFRAAESTTHMERMMP
jgi:hypothetical protein